MGTDIKIRFEYDAGRDIYIAYPCCTLTSEADCLLWYHEYVRAFAHLGRRVDVIFVLDMFKVDARVRDFWGKYRNRVHENFTRHTVRVHTGEFELVLGKFTTQRDSAKDIPTAIEIIEKRRESVNVRHAG